MLELKIQNLETETMKLSVENQCFQEKLNTKNMNKLKETENLFKLKYLRFIMKNNSINIEKRRILQGFNQWKTIIFQEKIVETKIECGRKMDKLMGIFKLVFSISKPIKRALRNSVDILTPIHHFSSVYPSISKENSFSLLQDSEIQNINQYFNNQNSEPSEKNS